MRPDRTPHGVIPLTIFKGCMAARQVRGSPKSVNPTARGISLMFILFRRSVFPLVMAIFCMLGAAALGQGRAPVGEKRPARPARDSKAEANEFGKADPEIAKMLKEVSAEHVQATIEKLVSFGNRSTLSAQDEAGVASG